MTTEPLCSIEAQNLSLLETADQVGLSLITVRRISRTLKIGPYRELAPSSIRPKSSQTPFGWVRINGALEQHRRIES